LRRSCWAWPPSVIATLIPPLARPARSFTGRRRNLAVTANGHVSHAHTETDAKNCPSLIGKTSTSRPLPTWQTPIFSLLLRHEAPYHALLKTGFMNRHFHPARGFTLIELIVVLAVIAIMMSFTYPVYLGISQRAKAAKDMSNLRQIGMATQLYMNDSSGVFPGSATLTWMSQLEQNQKYLSAWRVLESPFDTRPTSESGGANAMISYGINANIHPGGVAISADKITKPTAFIVFAPAQKSGATVSFQGVGNSAGPSGQGVTVLANASNPGGTATGGTQNNRTTINALFADWHAETMAWSGTGPAFTHTTSTGGDPDGYLRWNPF
jgi:prepilin-type N-terminal cleavage/methylation domain-containing protein/prepilin-type processing-associated H-X9-DG protein